MAHLRSSSYYQDSHDDYASSSSSHHQPYYDRSLHIPKTERRGRPAYTTVRPFIIDSRNSPIARSHDTMAHDLNRHVGDYVADRLVPTLLRSSDRPVEVFMNFGEANLALPNLDHWSEHGHGRRVPSKGPNAIIYNAPACSLTLDGRRCDRYCDHCDLLNQDQHNRDRHHFHNHDHHRELDLELDRRRSDRHPRSRSHVRIISHSRNPSPSPLPLPNRDRHYHLDRGLDLELDRRRSDRHPRSHSHVRIVSHSRNPSPSPDPLPSPGLFPIATAVEKAAKHTNRSHRVSSHALCPGCLIKTTVYRDGYCADCGPPTYSSSSRRADVLPMSSGGTRVQYVRETKGSASDDSWARVEVGSRADRDRRTGRGRSNERVKVYDVLTDNRGYGGDARRRGGSKWEGEGRSMPRYSGYVSESDL